VCEKSETKKKTPRSAPVWGGDSGVAVVDLNLVGLVAVEQWGYKSRANPDETFAPAAMSNDGGDRAVRRLATPQGGTQSTAFD
jgi:hypothetical protein